MQCFFSDIVCSLHTFMFKLEEFMKNSGKKSIYINIISSLRKTV